MIADLSHHNGEIDWKLARNALDFAIFRASVGGIADTRYAEYVRGYGKPFAAYHYLKAGTAEEARVEARFFLDSVRKAERSPTVYFGDVEFEAQTAETTEAVCAAFLGELRAQGCKKVGLYLNSRYPWAGRAIAMSNCVWVPRWGKDDGQLPGSQYYPKFPCDLWQYTSKGSVPGISGHVDLNTLFGGKTIEWFLDAEGSDAKMFKNTALVAYCEKVYELGWVYWYGTVGYKCTEDLYQRKKAQYPSHYGSSRTEGYMADVRTGKTCADCVGLIKSFAWRGGDINAETHYDGKGTRTGCPDESANGMFELCKQTGKIDSIPDIPGLCVWRSGHIGVYVGGGYTVEMRGFAYDCQRRKVSEGTWTHWGKLPFIEYSGEIKPAKYNLGDRTLKRGMSGNDVRQLQDALLELNYRLPKYGADADYGAETEAAVKTFQQDHGLRVDGIFGSQSLKALNEELMDSTAPTAEDVPEGGGEPVYALTITGSKNWLTGIQALYGGEISEVVG